MPKSMKRLNTYAFSYQLDRLAPVSKSRLKAINPDRVWYRPQITTPKSMQLKLHRFVVVSKKSQSKCFWKLIDASHWLNLTVDSHLTLRGITHRIERIPVGQTKDVLGYNIHMAVAQISHHERWRMVRGYPNYRVSSYGRVRSIPHIAIRNGYELHLSGHFLRQSIIRTGYLRIYLRNKHGRRSFSVSKLVAMAFLPNPHHYSETCHLDGNKANNTVANLKWCDRNYNIHYGNRTRKTYQPVALVRDNQIYRFVSITSAAKWVKKTCHIKTDIKKIKGCISNCANPKNKYSHSYGFEIHRI